MGSRLRAVAVAAVALAVAGCASGPAPEPSLPGRVALASVPFFPQREYECGPAALASVLSAAGVAVDADALAPAVYLPGRQGSLQAELVAATRGYDRLPYVLEPTPAALYAELAAGRPVLVLQNFGTARLPRHHYAVAIGYEPGRVLLRSGTDELARPSSARFFATWERGGRWAMVALPPGELPARADPRRYLEAVAALESVGRPGPAAVAYDAATRAWPDAPAAWLGLGNARLATGDAAGAEAAFRAALDVAPGDVAARNNLATLLARRGCGTAARTAIAQAAADAAGTPLEAAVAATRREIESERAADAPGCPAP